MPWQPFTSTEKTFSEVGVTTDYMQTNRLGEAIAQYT